MFDVAKENQRCRETDGRFPQTPGGVTRDTWCGVPFRSAAQSERQTCGTRGSRDVEACAVRSRFFSHDASVTTADGAVVIRTSAT